MKEDPLDSYIYPYLKKSSLELASRGPDGEGLWVDENNKIGFAHRRLSIIDTREVSNQPMIDPENSNCIVFNGEIYNFKEIQILDRPRL